MDVKKVLPPVYASSIRKGSKPEITLSGLTETEVENLEGMIRGVTWVKGEKETGRLVFSPGHKPSPEPTEDDMLPHWRRPTEEERKVDYELFDTASYEIQNHLSASISIQHLCGYNYSAENYTFFAERLESYGFNCLRSRRGTEGMFWEVWFLPGLYSARGELKEALKRATTDASNLRWQLDIALEFLRRNVSFGTLDISVQRMAMAVPD